MNPCFDLRDKGMFYKSPQAADPEHEAVVAKLFGKVDTTAYWCDRTQTGRGPDDKPCNKESCSKPGRSCYRGLGTIT